MKKCLFCAEEIQDEAILCKHCGKKVKNFEEGFIGGFLTKFNFKKLLPVRFIKLNFKKLLSIRFNKKKLITALIILVILILGVVWFTFNRKISFFSIFNVTNFAGLNETNWTLNPPVKDDPMFSVVKIISNENDKLEKSGSGILFSDEGYILTNAHVVMSELGEPIKNIKICVTESGSQKPKCDYEAELVDGDYSVDIAVIKAKKKITEIKPYYLVVNDNYEKKVSEILPIGVDLKVVGYPGNGGETITVTKGIVSGYKYDSFIYKDGGVASYPAYIKTDSEINFGNSGGAVFDKDNRYVGIPKYINKDDGGKLGYVIFWPTISDYLVRLIYEDKLKLSDRQYIQDRPKGEEGIWDGIKAYYREDYEVAKEHLEEGTKNNNPKAWRYLCSLYSKTKDIENFQKCAEELRSKVPNAQALSWIYSTEFYLDKKDQDKALEALSHALDSLPDHSILLSHKAFILNEKNKTDEAEKIIDKVIGLDPGVSLAWYVKSLIAIKKGDVESGLQYSELSFSLNPDKDTAVYLGEQYFFAEGNKHADVVKSLKYNIAALVLGSKNPSVLNKINLLMVNYLGEDGDASLNKRMNDIKDILSTFGLDSSLIEPLEKMDDAEIEAVLKENDDKVTINPQKIESYRVYSKLMASWLYSFVGDKEQCKNFSYNGSVADLIKLLEQSEIKKDLVVPTINFNSVMACLCELDDIVDEKVKMCSLEKQTKLCGENLIFTDEGRCITTNQACLETYGTNVYATGDGGCNCANGYEWNFDKTSCIKTCPDRKHSSGNYCVCDSGYISSGGQCYLAFELCTYRESYYNGACNCKSEYPNKRNGKCLTHDEDCKQSYGYLSIASPDGASCYCSPGYKWANDIGTNPNYCVSI